MEVGATEVSRVAAWALRGLGMAFEVADRAAPLFGWTEAVEGRALGVLSDVTPMIDGPRPADWGSPLSDASWAFDGTGRSLLEIGPVAIDLLTLAARTGQIGRVDLSNVLDPVFLSGVMRIAAKRKVGVLALSTGPHLSLCGQPVTALHAFPGPHGPLFDEVGPSGIPAFDRVAEAALAQLAPSGSGSTTISLLSYMPTGTAPGTAPSRFDAEGKFALARANGVQVERRGLAHLYELEVRTWAPTSERSRGQALA
jgi:hypothetical protein